MRSSLAPVLAAIAALSSLPARSQADFPEGASTPSAQQIQEYISGRKFQSTLANGNLWRYQYDSNGYIFFNAGGYAESGKWRVEDGRVCTEMQRAGANCSEARFAGGTLYLKRSNGEILKVEPR